MSILVVGFGNELQGDDGAGPEVVRRLRGLGLPSGVRVEEGGADSLRIVSLWLGEGQVWLVDALRRGRAPGTLHRLHHVELFDVAQRSVSAHELSLPESVRLLATTFPALGSVRWRLWGIEPERLGFGAGLSLPVSCAVDRVVAEIHGCALGRVPAHLREAADASLSGEHQPVNG
jgi:hydrogenase maturation protease